MKLPIIIALVLAAAAADAVDAAEPQKGAADIVVTATTVDPARLAEEEQQLRRNLRQMREMFERDKANSDNASRGNTSGIYVNPADSPSVGMMREQLARSMERLENRCFGIEAKATNGNVIMICGDNSGTADNEIIRSSADTTIVLPPANAATPVPDPAIPPPASAPPPAAGAATDPAPTPPAAPGT